MPESSSIKRKRTEEDLRNAYNYSRSLLEASLDPLVTISTDGKITDVNKATELATGIPRARLIGSIASAMENLKVSIQEADARITSDALPRLPVDSTQMEQLFQNLIGNAVKFRSKQPPEIHIAASHRPGEWVFSVRDNGIGISPQYAERIFMIFQRLHTRRKYPGTGIGLAICKKIVERHGGKIWVDPSPGKGSIFHFTIPD